eukprot:5438-Pelagococcus_subviridis.AAC.1
MAFTTRTQSYGKQSHHDVVLFFFIRRRRRRRRRRGFADGRPPAPRLRQTDLQRLRGVLHLRREPLEEISERAQREGDPSRRPDAASADAAAERRAAAPGNFAPAARRRVAWNVPRRRRRRSGPHEQIPRLKQPPGRDHARGAVDVHAQVVLFRVQSLVFRRAR